MNNQVGHIALHKQLSRLQPGQSFRRDTAVGTASSQKAWLLRQRQPLKEARILFIQKPRAILVVTEAEMSFIDVNSP
ncbi:hypothetical protein BG74_05480 [Sodalis-like endosymbiont of Proechinophthirus fluctus]|nr:hypothetical protein BG74_05480 [Sodalis-like endosymbiont of Proechinophthirus fluctus]